MLKNVLLLILVSMTWGIAFAVLKIAEYDFKAITVMACRCSIGFIILLIVSIAQKRDIRGNLKHFWMFLLFSLLGIVVCWILLAEGLEYTSASIGSIMDASIPIFTYAILLFILRTEKFEVLGVTGLIVALVGLFFTVGYKKILAGDSTTLGFILLTGSFFSFALNAIIMERIAKGIDVVVTTTYVLGISSVLLWLIAIVTERPLASRISDIDLLSEFYLGVLVSAGGYFIYYYLIQKAGAYFTSMMFYMIPIFGVIGGALLLKEKISYNQMLGMVVVFIGLYIVNREKFKNQ